VLAPQEALALARCAVNASMSMGRATELLAILDIPAWVYTLVNQYVAKEEAAYSSRLCALKLLTSLAKCLGEVDHPPGEVVHPFPSTGAGSNTTESAISTESESNLTASQRLSVSVAISAKYTRVDGIT
jgi:hypothetical protein